MNKVKRYDLDEDLGFIFEDDQGEYVDHSDYLTLEQYKDSLKFDLEETNRRRKRDTKQLVEAKRENKVLREALEWYRNMLGQSNSMCNRVIIQDGGSKAREALNK
jgi:hypothetical protein